MEEWTLDLIPCLKPLIQVYYFESHLCDNGDSVIIYHCFSLNTALCSLYSGIHFGGSFGNLAPELWARHSGLWFSGDV